jgi:hypothetical protein
VILTNAEEDSDVSHWGFLIRRAKHGGMKPSLPLEKYTGEYSEHWHGQNTIRQESTGLVISLHRASKGVGDLRHGKGTIRLKRLGATAPSRILSVTAVSFPGGFSCN